MSETELRYSQIEKEALALTWAAEKFQEYITGLDIVLETDHKPLLQLLQTKNLDDLTPRLQRFRIRSYVVKTDRGEYRRNRWHLIPAPYHNNNIEEKDYVNFETLVSASSNNNDEMSLVNQSNENQSSHKSLEERTETQGNDNHVNNRPLRERKKPVWLGDYITE
ncbi:unnamed protein product [Arctia plantaginis]|uniref:Reverse transcriptase RNase H-like domain-containing protein n=1 Tax=Arctia plantaginis TaxID=874455 RepID=A0A8S1BY44_ARCPL|nr:unnamed protein product [Arctia plantaginis]